MNPAPLASPTRVSNSLVCIILNVVEIYINRDDTRVQTVN